MPLTHLRASVLKEFLTDMKPVLQDLQHLIQIWNKECRSVLPRIKFVFVYTSEMKSLQEEVGGLYRRIQGLLSLLSSGNARSNAIAEKARQEKERKMDLKKREKHEDQVRDLLLQILKEKGEENISAAATSSDTSLWKQLEKELEAKGLSHTYVKQLMDPIKKEINRTVAPSPKKDLPIQPEKSTPNPASGKLSPEGDSARNATRSPSPQPQSSHNSSATILVVDRTNGGEHIQSTKALSFLHPANHSSPFVLPVRSIVAQAYLELIRAWTVNTTDRWLFCHVSSAGTNVKTHFSTSVANVPAWELPGRPVLENWITELSGPRSYFWSENGPGEKETILNKMRQWKRCGIREFHFKRFSHILCFDRETYVILMKMKALVQNPLASATPSSDSSTVDSVIHFLGPQKSFKVPLAQTVEGVKTNLKNFLIKEFNWIRPLRSITGGSCRTQLLWISSDLTGKIMGKGEATRKTIEEQSQCRIIIERRRLDGDMYGRTVAIVGKMAAVEKAKGLIWETSAAA